jgi:hypothetical protein
LAEEAQLKLYDEVAEWTEVLGAPGVKEMHDSGPAVLLKICQPNEVIEQKSDR